MKTNIIRIGNLKGVCIPKSILEKCGLEGSVEMSVENNALVIAPARRVHEGRSD